MIEKDINIALENDLLKENLASKDAIISKLNSKILANSIANTQDFTYDDLDISKLETLQANAINFDKYLTFRQGFFNNLNQVSSGQAPTNNFSFEFYLMVLNRVAYFANLINYKSENINLQKALIQLFQNVAFFGEAILVYNIKENKFFAPKLFSLKFDDYLDIDLKQTTFNFGNKEYKNDANFKIYHLQLNLSKFGIWVLTYEYLINVVKMIHGSLAMTNVFKNLIVEKSPTNIVSNFSNKSGLYDWDKAIINVKIDDDDIAKSVENIFEVLKIEGANFQYLQGQIQYYMSFWDKQIGIRVNVETSQSSGARAISGEVLPTSFAIDKKEMEYYHYVDIFFESLKADGIIVKWNYPNLVISDSYTDNKPEGNTEGGNTSPGENNEQSNNI